MAIADESVADESVTWEAELRTALTTLNSEDLPGLGGSRPRRGRQLDAHRQSCRRWRR